MKKILAILSSSMIFLSTITTVVSCNTDRIEEPGVPDKDSFVIKITENNEAMSDEQIAKLLAEHLSVSSKKLTNFETEFKLSEIKRNHGILLGQKILVSPTASSTILNKDMELYLQKDFSYVQDWFSFKGSDKQLGEQLKTKLFNEIKTWAPEAVEDIDYNFKYTDLHWGDWLFEFKQKSKLIFGNLDIKFETEKFELEDISYYIKVENTFDVDEYHNNFDEIKEVLIGYIKELNPYAELGIDFEIIPPETIEDGKLIAQEIRIYAPLESRYFEGSFYQYTKKNLTDVINDALDKKWNRAQDEDGIEEWFSYSVAAGNDALQLVKDIIKKWAPSLTVPGWPDYKVEAIPYEPDKNIDHGSWSIEFFNWESKLIYYSWNYKEDFVTRSIRFHVIWS